MTGLTILLVFSCNLTFRSTLGLLAIIVVSLVASISAILVDVFNFSCNATPDFT